MTISKEDQDRITSAIRAAEAKTSGEIVCVLARVSTHATVLPVFVALIVLQLLSSGLNLLGANQHLATALWGVLMIVVMAARGLFSSYFASLRKKV